MKLLDLPPELVARIISFTLPTGFESAMLTCKLFYKLGEVHCEEHNRLTRAYKDFHFENEGPDMIRDSWELLQAIAKEPIIAEYIETLWLHEDGNSGMPGEYSLSTEAVQNVHDEDRNLLKDLVRRSKYPVTASIDEQTWVDRMEQGVDDGEGWYDHPSRIVFSSVFLLTLLPNVTALSPPREWAYHLDEADDNNKPLVDLLCNVVRRANSDASHTAPLSKLKDIYPYGAEDVFREQMSLEILGVLLALPSMRSISVVNGAVKEQGDHQSRFRWLLPELTSPVESIELWTSAMEDGEPKKLLEKTRQLRSYKHTHESKRHGPGQDWNAQMLVETLQRCCSDTLTDVSLTITKITGDLTGRVSCLKGFPKLKNVEMDVRMFGAASKVRPKISCLAEILPAAIETVRIHSTCGDGSDPDEMMVLRSLFSGFQKDLAAKLPNLQWVKVVRQTSGEHSGWIELKELLKSEGCEIEEVKRARAVWVEQFLERFEYADGENLW